MAKKPKKQGPTAQETALAQTSAFQWDDYKARFRPAEAALIDKAQFTAGEKARLKGEVAADTAAAFKGLTRSTVAANKAAGAGVSSGKTKLSLAGNAIAQGRAKGVGQGVAVTGGRVDADMQKLKIAGFGRQISVDAMADMERGARRATNLALAASQAKFEKNQAIAQGVATVAGAAFERYRLGAEKRKPKSVEEALQGRSKPYEFDFGPDPDAMPWLNANTSAWWGVGDS